MEVSQNSAALDVSIVMPCLNEAATIAACVDAAAKAIVILRERHGFSGEVIVADNGSTDGSQEIARAHGARVVDVAERGYGAALRGGFAAARGRFLVMADSDCSYDFLESVPMVEQLAAGADLCMGSRFRGEIKPGAMPWKNRYIGNPALSGILRLLFRTHISDSHCGIRAISADALRRLKLASTGMEFASEMVLKSALLRLTVAEVPVTLWPDKRGRAPHLKPLRDGLRHLFFMLMLSPASLFMAPAAVLAIFGSAVFALLLFNPDAEMVRFGRFGIGDHWAIVASSALIIAVQTFIVGLATMVLGIREGYFLPRPRTRRLMAYSGLKSWLIASLVLTCAGLIWAFVISAGWIRSDFGPLNEIRSLIAAFTAIVVGIQAGFGGFLLSVVAGNKMKHAPTE